MARGVPVVTTTVGAQGITDAGDCFFCGDKPEEFAAGVRASANAGAAQTKAQAALEFVRTQYSRARMIAVFQQVLPAARSISKAA